MKTVKVTEKVKIFLESVTKTVLYVTCTPLNSNVESLTLPLLHKDGERLLSAEYWMFKNSVFDMKYSIVELIRTQLLCD